MAIILRGNDVMQAALHALQGAADEYRPAGIVGGGNAVFGVPPYT